MNRRRAFISLAATIVVGLALIVAGVALGELSTPNLLPQLPLHIALAYSTIGYWAETRGLVDAPTWLTRPDRLLRAIVARMGGAL